MNNRHSELAPNKNISSTSLLNYTITGLISKGGEGSVYSLMTDKGKAAACKKVQLREAGTLALRVLQEIRVLKSMNNENIVRLTDAFYEENNGHPCLYMVFDHYPYTLSTMIKEGVIRSTIQRKMVIIQLANALRYLHSQGIIHRDIVCL